MRNKKTRSEGEIRDRINNLIKITESFLNMVENIIHNQQVNNYTYIHYIIHHLAYHIKLK
jgi:hypothetical protein